MLYFSFSYCFKSRAVFSKYPPVGPAKMTKVLGGQLLTPMAKIMNATKAKINGF